MGTKKDILDKKLMDALSQAESKLRHSSRSSRYSFLDRELSKTSTGTKRGRICVEAKFPPQYVGCYCLKYSPDESTFAASFGTGGVQV